jgi:hypothetical protein
MKYLRIYQKYFCITILTRLALYVTFGLIPKDVMIFCRRYLVIILFAFALKATTQSQVFRYKVGYFGFLDNREYFNPYVNDQTIFGSRVYGEVGMSLNDNNRIMAGIDYLYEFGSKGELLAPDITLYYNGRHKNLDFYLGAFPRLNYIDMPLALMIDTFQYYRPNVEGILLDYKTSFFRHNIWIDWTGRQSFDKREAFMAGFSGWAKKGIFTYQHHVVMSHLASSTNQNADEHLRDNGGYSAMIGLDLSSVTSMDTLAFSAGFLGSWDRLRGVYDLVFPFGWLGEMEAGYRGFGVHGTIYSGDSQAIVSGDGFYKSTFYSRADVYYQVARSGIEGRVQFSFHVVPEAVDLSMSLMIRAQLEGIFRGHHSN